MTRGYSDACGGFKIDFWRIRSPREHFVPLLLVWNSIGEFTAVWEESERRAKGRDSTKLSFQTPRLMATQTANALLAAHQNLIQRVRSQQKTRRQILEDNGFEVDFPEIPSPSRSPPPEALSDSTTSSPSRKVGESSLRADLPPEKKARMKRYRNYIPEEETIRNDYSQHYVDSGEWPQNWILGAAPEERFDEYVFTLYIS